MDIIFDELIKNNADIDKATLSYQIHFCLEHHKTLYEQMVCRIDPEDLVVLFHDLNVSNFGRAITHLSPIYFVRDSCSEDLIRYAVKLAAERMKDFNIQEFMTENSFFRKVVGFVKRIFFHYKLNKRRT